MRISKRRVRVFRLRAKRARAWLLQFAAAAKKGDVASLTKLLAEDAVLYSDGGGKRAAALNPIYGADKILRFLAGITRKNPALLTVQARAATVNGLAGSGAA